MCHAAHERLYYYCKTLGAIHLIGVMREHNVKYMSAAALSTPPSYDLICLRLVWPPCSSQKAEDDNVNDNVQLCMLTVAIMVLREHFLCLGGDKASSRITGT